MNKIAEILLCPSFEEFDRANWFQVVRASVRNMHAVSYEPCILEFWNFIYGLMEKSPYLELCPF